MHCLLVSQTGGIVKLMQYRCILPVTASGRYAEALRGKAGTNTARRTTLAQPVVLQELLQHAGSRLQAPLGRIYRWSWKNKPLPLSMKLLVMFLLFTVTSFRWRHLPHMAPQAPDRQPGAPWFVPS
jgi:hypothetical protein